MGIKNIDKKSMKWRKGMANTMTLTKISYINYSPEIQIKLFGFVLIPIN